MSIFISSCNACFKAVTRTCAKMQTCVGHVLFQVFFLDFNSFLSGVIKSVLFSLVDDGLYRTASGVLSLVVSRVMVMLNMQI